LQDGLDVFFLAVKWDDDRNSYVAVTFGLPRHFATSDGTLGHPKCAAGAGELRNVTETELLVITPAMSVSKFTAHHQKAECTGGKLKYFLLTAPGGIFTLRGSLKCIQFGEVIPVLFHRAAAVGRLIFAHRAHTSDEIQHARSHTKYVRNLNHPLSLRP
jgi:hypothetical protein